MRVLDERVPRLRRAFERSSQAQLPAAGASASRDLTNDGLRGEVRPAASWKGRARERGVSQHLPTLQVASVF